MIWPLDASKWSGVRTSPTGVPMSRPSGNCITRRSSPPNGPDDTSIESRTVNLVRRPIVASNHKPLNGAISDFAGVRRLSVMRSCANGARAGASTASATPSANAVVLEFAALHVR